MRLRCWRKGCANRSMKWSAGAALTEHVWEAAHEPLSNTIDVCVQRLRRKIDAPGQPSLIVTRRSEGYMLSVDGES